MSGRVCQHTGKPKTARKLIVAQNRIRRLQPVAVITSYSIHYTKLYERCTAQPGAEPAPLEGQELLWADATALRRLRFLPSGAAVLARLEGELLASECRGLVFNHRLTHW